MTDRREFVHRHDDFGARQCFARDLNCFQPSEEIMLEVNHVGFEAFEETREIPQHFHLGAAVPERIVFLREIEIFVAPVVADNGVAMNEKLAACPFGGASHQHGIVIGIVAEFVEQLVTGLLRAAADEIGMKMRDE